MRRRQILAKLADLKTICERQPEELSGVIHPKSLAEAAVTYGPIEGMTLAEILEPVPAPKACPKCGRELGRGAHFHLKACKG